MLKLEQKVAIITGGAGGIGYGIAKAFVHEGAKVIIVDNNETAGKTSVAELKVIQPEAVFIHADLTDYDTYADIIKKTVETFGRIDVLVNNAQAAVVKPLMALTPEEVELPFRTGFFPTFYLTQAAFPYLKESKGHVINIASAAGIQGTPNQGAYAAAKEAIRGFSRVAANEFGPHHIKVNVICPLAASSGMMAWAEQKPADYQATLSRIPLGRLGDSEKDIGRVAVFLASEDSDYISGQTINVDGGSVKL